MNKGTVFQGTTQQELQEFLRDGGSLESCETTNGKNALHFAVLDGNVGLVEALLEAGMDVNGKTTYGFTPLHFSLHAAKDTDVAVMRLLLHKGADLSLKNYAAQTPLQFLLEDWNNTGKRDVNALFTLVEHGADIFEKNRAGLNAFQLACYKGDPLAMEYLLNQGATVEPRWGRIHLLKL